MSLFRCAPNLTQLTSSPQVNCVYSPPVNGLSTGTHVTSPTAQFACKGVVGSNPDPSCMYPTTAPFSAAGQMVYNGIATNPLPAGTTFVCNGFTSTKFDVNAAQCGYATLTAGATNTGASSHPAPIYVCNGAILTNPAGGACTYRTAGVQSGNTITYTGTPASSGSGCPSVTFLCNGITTSTPNPACRITPLLL